MKKLFIIALLALSLAACGGDRGDIALSGEMKLYTAREYTIELPEECENTASELVEIAAQYEGCSVTVVSMPIDQATLSESKKEFTEYMEAMGYNLTVTDYKKSKINGMDAYRAEYSLEKTKITQITFAAEDIAYVATYARPADVSKDIDEIFIEGLESFELKMED